jgi:formylglycine-generating enzyme required for sulfatase activity
MRKFLGEINSLLMALIVFASIPANALDNCNRILGGIEKVDGTQGLIAYLGTMIEHQILGDDHLIRLINGLEAGNLENPIANEEASINSGAQIHREEIQEYLSSTNLNRQLLAEWAKAAIKEKSRIHVRREDTKGETKDIYFKMIFHDIEPGEFYMGSGSKELVKIEKPFAMMATTVTQLHWAEIMGSNPSRFLDGEYTTVIAVDGRTIKLQPDNPVEMVSANEGAKFISRLNELSKSGDPILKRLIPDFKQGDEFRLPTDAEWEFVVRARGAANGTYFFGDDESKLPEYAWFIGNSGNATHPVGQLKPLVIGENEFYDMHGNVWEWASISEISQNGHRVPQNPKPESFMTMVGGSHVNIASSVHSSFRFGAFSGFASHAGTGLRLVRIRP